MDRGDVDARVRKRAAGGGCRPPRARSMRSCSRWTWSTRCAIASGLVERELNEDAARRAAHRASARALQEPGHRGARPHHRGGRQGAQREPLRLHAAQAGHRRARWRSCGSGARSTASGLGPPSAVIAVLSAAISSVSCVPREQAAEAARIELRGHLAPRACSGCIRRSSPKRRFPTRVSAPTRFARKARSALDRGNAAEARAAVAELDQLATAAAPGIHAAHRRTARG